MINQNELHQRIVYEDNHLISVNKKPSWLVQGDKTGDESLVDALKIYLKQKYSKPGDVFLGSFHRLDRPVSGLVTFAKTSKALERMNKIFAGRAVNKTYLAITAGHPPKESSVITHFLLKDVKTNIVKAYSREMRYPPAAKEAVLEYKLLKTNGKISLLEIHPITGRSHQIRAQLAAIGCVIVGDLKYGYPSPLPDKSIALHGYSIEFDHPVQHKPLKIVAEIPDSEWWKRL
jgi:23S rRNA pseudouridine1911/1915/1917 synthase